MNGARLAIVLTVSQQFLFAVDTMAIHRLGGSVSLMQIGFLRALGGIVLVLCIAPALGWKMFYTRHPFLQAARALVTVGYAWVLVLGFAWLPLSDATAIGYVSGLYVVLLAGPALGEIVGMRRYMAVIVGIAGALLIVKPGMSQVSWLYVAVLLGTVLNALAIVFTKYLRRDDSATTILLYVQLAQLVVFAPGAFESWEGAVAVWPWIAAAGVTGPLGMYLGILALRHADASLLAPYAYIRLVIATVAAMAIFGETLDTLSIAGSCIIVAACWYATRTRLLQESSRFLGRTWTLRPVI